MSAEIIQHPASQRARPKTGRRPTFPLTRRHVFYVPGYDARGIRTYRKLFREGCEGLESVYGVETTMSKVQRRDGNHVWEARVSADDWSVETTYEFLQWDDLVRRDLARPQTWKIWRGLRAAAYYLFSGAGRRFVEETWQFAVFTAYPFLGLGALGLAGLMVGLIVALALGWLGAGAVAWVAGAVAAVAVSAGLFKKAGRPLFIDYLLVDTIATLDYARRRRPDWDERLDALAARIAAVAEAGEVDEILVVGHSSGSFLAIDVTDRALRLEPFLGRIGPRLGLLTLGSVTPIVSFLPEAGWFREALERLGRSDRLTWLEYQARKDVISVFRSDPLESCGIMLDRDERMNPTVVPVQLRNLVHPSTYRALQGHYFKIHFLFVSAAERPCEFDYHMIALGPVPLALRARFGDEAVAAVLPDRKASAWNRLLRTAHEV